MALAKIYDRVGFSTTTAGTGTLTVGAALTDALNGDFLTPAQAGVPDGTVVSFLIVDGNNFEINTGTYTVSGTTLSRGTPVASKISGTAGTTLLTLSGNAKVFFVPSAKQGITLGSDQFQLDSSNGTALLNGGALAGECMQILSAAYTLTSQTAAQKLLNASTNGALTVAVGLWWFECLFSLTAMSATSGSFGFALGGTATFTQAWHAEANKNALATATGGSNTFNTAANTTLVAANTTQTGFAIIHGIVRVTAAGTIIPQVSLGIAAAAVVGANSYAKFKLLDGTSSKTVIGNWS